MRARTWLALGVVATVLTAAVTVADPAGAADLAVTVTPATDLVDGQSVRVVVTGAAPNASVSIRQCPGGPVDPFDCAVAPPPFLSADPSGSVNADLYLEAAYLTFAGATIDCRVAPGCVLHTVATGAGGISQQVRTAVTFRPDAPLNPPPTISVTPATDLVDGQVVDVAGAGFLPNSFVVVAQCREPAAGFQDCQNDGTALDAAADGTISTPHELTALLFTSSGDEVDCRVERCVLIATRDFSNAAPRLTATAALGFRPGGPLLPPPVLTIEPASGIVDGQDVTVRGSGFRSGSIAVAQCSDIPDDAGRCGQASRFVDIDATGTFSVTLPVQVLLRTVNRYVDCRDGGCTVVALNFDGGNPILAEKPIAFDRAGPGPVLPEVSIAPGGRLAARSGALAVGEGFAPASQVAVRQCRLVDGLPTICEANGSNFTSVASDGTFVLGTLVRAVIDGPDGTETDCRRRRCALVAEPVGVDPPGIGRLDFGRATAPPRRYFDPFFAAVDVTEGVVYRTTTNSRGTTVGLKLDVYEPAGDRARRRPAVMWMFGGYFGSGDRSQLRDLAMALARRGFVSVAIDYRTRPEIFNGTNGCIPVGGTCLDPTQIAPAITDARDDARAAMVWLREHAAQYRIAPEAITAAGWSAGAITALNLAHDVTGARPAASIPAAAVSLAGVLAAGANAGDPPSLMLGGNRDNLLSLNSQVAGCGSIVRAGAACDFVAYAATMPPASADPCVTAAVQCTYVLGRDGEHGFLFQERPDVIERMSRFLGRKVLGPAGLLRPRYDRHHGHGNR